MPRALECSSRLKEPTDAIIYEKILFLNLREQQGNSNEYLRADLQIAVKHLHISLFCAYTGTPHSDLPHCSVS